VFTSRIIDIAKRRGVSLAAAGKAGQ
jgi:hypothetical protein